MARFYGKIGYSVNAEAAPGVWEPQITEREYYGDVTRNTRRVDSGQQMNDNLNVSNVISIVADDFATENLPFMVYVEYMGNKWKITNVEILYPRLNLTIGGLYNGQTEDGAPVDP